MNERDDQDHALDESGEYPLCMQAGWCCGCTHHPHGKPWGPKHRAWDVHYETCPGGGTAWAAPSLRV